MTSSNDPSAWCAVAMKVPVAFGAIAAGPVIDKAVTGDTDVADALDAEFTAATTGVGALGV